MNCKFRFVCDTPITIPNKHTWPCFECPEVNRMFRFVYDTPIPVLKRKRSLSFESCSKHLALFRIPWNELPVSTRIRNPGSWLEYRSRKRRMKHWERSLARWLCLVNDHEAYHLCLSTLSWFCETVEVKAVKSTMKKPAKGRGGRICPKRWDYNLQVQNVRARVCVCIIIQVIYIYVYK